MLHTVRSFVTRAARSHWACPTCSYLPRRSLMGGRHSSAGGASEPQGAAAPVGAAAEATATAETVLATGDAVPTGGEADHRKACGQCRGCSVEGKCLVGTWSVYGRHVFVSTGAFNEWDSKVERSNPFLEEMSRAIKAVNEGKTGLETVKFTACSPESFASTASLDRGFEVLVFPDGVVYSSMKAEHIPAFVRSHLVEGKPLEELDKLQGVGGTDVFVCTHAKKDVRCGEKGPPVAQAFVKQLEAQGLCSADPLRSKVRVWRASHVGGHKYAGNVLVYPPGDCYGYVTPDDVPTLIEQAIVTGTRVRRLWRGAMGLTESEQASFRDKW